MIRKLSTLLLLGAGMMLGNPLWAQNSDPCGTHTMNDEYKLLNPHIEKYEQEVNNLLEGLKQSNLLRSQLKGTGTFGPNDTLHIPLVVHVIHDYNYQTSDVIGEYVSDNEIYKMVGDINEVFLAQNNDLSQVIAPFQPYIGNPRIQFHLASKDPKGNATKGITRTQSYLTYGGDDQAKLGQWDPSSYLNIWLIRRIGRGGQGGGTVLAYAVFPTSAAAFPYNDGVISAARYIDDGEKTIAHEIGHILGLYHTWGNVQGDVGDCSGDDEVDDTPPTDGHNTNICPLYDTTCTNNISFIGKQLLDPTLSPQVVTTSPIGVTYVPRTNLTIESINIYPSVVGKEFRIVNQKLNPSNGTYTTIDVYETQDSTIGRSSLGSNTMTTSNTSNRSAVEFDVLTTAIILDEVDIYPATVGDSFRVAVLKANGDTVKLYRGITTTNSGAQSVPLDAYVVKGSKYRLQMLQNPGLKSDTFYNSIPSYPLSVPTIAQINVHVDTDTTGTSTTNRANYKGRYNYFYNLDIRYGAITTTATDSQIVPVNFRISSIDSTYRILITENPGLRGDSIGIAPYVKSIPCVLDIKDDNTNGIYNLMYAWQIRYGYIKNCIDYPDTANTQNIMNYTSCPIMFTKGQVDRMRTMIDNNIGQRGKLVEEATHLRTGIITGPGGTYNVRLDLKPVPDFSMEPTPSTIGAERTFFMCAGETFYFRDRSWRDTITSATISLTNGASIQGGGNTYTIPEISLNNSIGATFSETGWVDVTYTAVGNNTGDATITKEDFLYVADPNNKINPQNGFMMDFDPQDAGNPISKWPMFNYFNNSQKWEIYESAGFYDNYSIRYNGFDSRTAPESYTGSPEGDYDDFFTPAFNLSGMQTNCQMSFMSSGAFRSADNRVLKDTLIISYSTNCGRTWTRMSVLNKDDIGNKGVVDVPYAPLWQGDWVLHNLNIPTPARVDGVFFRFTYKPGVDDVNISRSRTIPGTGNHFYIDRLNINEFPLGVSTLLDDNKSIAIAPNPTNGSAQLAIKSSSREMAQVQVTDITGKVVFTTSERLNGTITNVTIPATAIQVKGIYMVNVNVDGKKYTEKLVSY